VGGESRGCDGITFVAVFLLIISKKGAGHRFASPTHGCCGGIPGKWEEMCLSSPVQLRTGGGELRMVGETVVGRPACEERVGPVSGRWGLH
jgi:hypothetical protein